MAAAGFKSDLRPVIFRKAARRRLTAIMEHPSLNAPRTLRGDQKRRTFAKLPPPLWRVAYPTFEGQNRSGGPLIASKSRATPYARGFQALHLTSGLHFPPNCTTVQRLVPMLARTARDRWGQWRQSALSRIARMLPIVHRSWRR